MNWNGNRSAPVFGRNEAPAAMNAAAEDGRTPVANHLGGPRWASHPRAVRQEEDSRLERRREPASQHSTKPQALSKETMSRLPERSAPSLLHRLRFSRIPQGSSCRRNQLRRQRASACQESLSNTPPTALSKPAGQEAPFASTFAVGTMPAASRLSAYRASLVTTEWLGAGR